MKNILFIIDDLEYKYFEFNRLVTNFWLIREYLLRGHRVDITLKNKLFLKKDVPVALCYKTHLQSGDIKKEDSPEAKYLDEYNTIFFRPDPPVDIDYINASYVLEYVDKNAVFIINSPRAIRDKNEKLYVNEFQKILPDYIPDNIVAADEKVLKNFLFEKSEIIIKPTNLCFGSGVFYLNSKDKNINTILKTATNNFKTTVMAQEYLKGVEEGDKRLIYICGKLYDWCVKKVATNNDFKFNEHNKDTLKFAQLSAKEKAMEEKLKEKFEQDNIYLAGLDMIDDKIIEINVTSPCFFINEINEIFKINFETIITDQIEQYANSRSAGILDSLTLC